MSDVGKHHGGGGKRAEPEKERRYPKRIEQILRAQPLNEMKKGDLTVLKVRGEVSVQNRGG